MKVWPSNRSACDGEEKKNVAPAEKQTEVIRVVDSQMTQLSRLMLFVSRLLHVDEVFGSASG